MTQARDTSQSVPQVSSAYVSGMVSVITPSYGRFSDLVACVDSVHASAQATTGGLEMIVVTSGYAEGELASLRSRGCQVVELSSPVSASESRNTGVRSSTGEYLLFLDDDNVVAPEAAGLLQRSLAAWSDAVVVGPTMYYLGAPDRLWCAGVRRSRVLMKTTFRQDLPDVLPERMPSEDFPNCFMVRRSDFDAVDGFDATRFPQQWEEADLARRLVRSTRGRAYAVPKARLWHHIETQLAQRLHLRNAKRAFLCARGRAMFSAVHGDRLQWVAYVIAAQWMFAAFYIGAALSLPSGNRLGVVSGYMRGLWAGLFDGWRARNQDRAAAPSVQMRSGT